MGLKSIISLTLDLMHTKSLDLNTLQDKLNLSRGVTLENGTGANQADTLFHDTRTLADGADETLDFHDGTLSDAFGTPVTIDELKAIYIKNNSAAAGLLVGGALANAMGLFADASDILKLPPGGEFLLTAPGAAGIDITTNADLLIAHDGTGDDALTYDIVVIGVD
ncbi:MAG: hypothetical protein LLF76_03010 [Planctomycetaceae bacterium]|nr:hypothetical protein [Planctomycetaceae bacterium]